MQEYVSVTLTEFYELYPEFNKTEYETIVQGQFKRSILKWGLKNSCRIFGNTRKTIIYLFTAHLAVLANKNMNGQNGTTPGSVASASVGEVSVSYVQIPVGNSAYKAWLALTPYGLELLGILESLAAPKYIGGSFERVYRT